MAVLYGGTGRLTTPKRRFPARAVTTVDWTTQNGPLRIVPGTQRLPEDREMPSLRDEPDWMKKGCCLCPIPAG